MRYLFSSFFIAILFMGCAASKKTNTNQEAFRKPINVKIYEQDNSGGLGPCEPSIFINPTNPSNIVAGSIIDYVHVSNDGGRSWDTESLQSKLGVWGDPVIVSDSDGRFYYLHLSDPDGTNWSSPNVLDRIVAQRSDDGGKTWNSGSGMGKNSPKQQDKEWAITDPSNNNLYVTWTEFDSYGDRSPDCHSRILFSMSTDYGETFGETITLSQNEGNCIDDDRTTEGAVPAADGKGNIYVAWAYDGKIIFDRSSDYGTTWLNTDKTIANQPGGWTVDINGLNRSNGMPITLVDHSGGDHDGRVYVCWADLRNGQTNSDIFITYSDDKGDNWVQPIRVNTDQTKTQQFLPWMDIDQTSGTLHVVYYDRSAYTDDLLTDVTVASSTNGGYSFTSQVISSSPFDPTGCPFFGDYNGINAHDGVIRPIWTRYENRKLSVWTALMDN